LIYAYKLVAPEVSADISLGIETAQITEEAMKQAEAELLKERGALGRVIAPRLMNNVKRNLGLPVYGDVIDLTAVDANEQPVPVEMPVQTLKPRHMSLFERVRAAGQVLINPTPATTRQYQANMSTPIITPATITPAPQVDPQRNEPHDHHPMTSPTPSEPKQEDKAATDTTEAKESEEAELQTVPLPTQPSGNGHKSQ
jgi:hypothetical protein